MTEKPNANELIAEFNKHCLNWYQLVMYRDPDFAAWISKVTDFLEDSVKENYKYEIRHR